jgi:3-oxoacyl-[acyl-carrier protein] reductase
MDLGLVGRVALVTGSSQGIGRATALLLGSERARVAVTYHRERDRALAGLDEIQKGGGEAVATHGHRGRARHVAT